MTSINLRHYYHNVEELPVLTISTLGFAAATEDRLKSLLQLERKDQPVYRWVSPSEANINVVLVNYDNPVALEKKSSLAAATIVVAVSQGPLADAPLYHLRGMLTAARVMAVLDKIPLPAPATVAPVPPIKLELVPKPPEPEVLVAAPAPAPVVVIPTPVAAPTPEPLRYRALVVDDSLAIQKSLQLKLEALEQIGGVDFAESGEAALAMAANNTYHLIFLDVMMPGMDGYETCTQLRKNPAYKKTPIIMVSGKTSPMDEVKGIMAGCTTYLTKPVQEEAFQKLSLRVLAWLTARS